MLSRETLTRALGVLECVAGVALLVQSCRYGQQMGEGVTNFVGMFMIASALFALIVPGSLLFLKSPLRWLSQLPLALVLVWLGFAAASRALGLR